MTRGNVWKNIDWFTVTLYLLMMLLGWVNIYSAAYNDEHQGIFDFTQRYGKQAIWIAAAIVIALGIVIVDSKFFISFAFPIYLFIVFMLIAVLLFGTEIKGARSWFQVGGFAIQPSEFAKFATAIALAKFLSSYNFKLKKFSSLAGIAAILLIPVMLIFLQNDTGSALVFVMFILVLYREGLPSIYLFLGVLAAVLFILTLMLSPLITVFILLIGAFVANLVVVKEFKESFRGMLIGGLIYVLIWGSNFLFKLDIGQVRIFIFTIALSMVIFSIYALRKRMMKLLMILGFLFASLLFIMSVDYVFNNVLKEHQQARINDVLGIVSDPNGIGYQKHQSKIAIGSGGFTGKGFLQGMRTKFDFIPEQSTDFIFCTIGEEWGFLGTSFTVLLFLTLFVRLIILAERQRTRFSRIYGYCVVSIIFFHFAINIGMTIGLMPVIGIPLPFFSYGGSSLWSFTVLLFVFLRLDASRLEQLGY